MANNQGFTLLNNASAAGSAASWSGGRGTAYCWATFGGGSVSLECSVDGGTTWLEVSNFTDNGIANFELSACLIRGNLATATGATLKVAGNGWA